MKKNTIGGVAFLVLLAVAVIALDHVPANFTESSPQAERGSEEYLLAISWQPAFCERRPNTPECRTQRSNRFDADNFSLHGLWPQPANKNYCGVSEKLISLDKSGRWRMLPPLNLSKKLRKELSQKMPGFRSYLHRHEWYKHGTCMPGYSPESYFRISLNLLDQINDNALRNLLAENIGARLEFNDLRYSMQRAYGKAAARRFIMDCFRDDGRRIIQEVKVSIAGKLMAQSKIAELISSAPDMPRSCPSGVVDAVGLQ